MFELNCLKIRADCTSQITDGWGSSHASQILCKCGINSPINKMPYSV